MSEILVLIALMLLNAFFAMSEIAMVQSSKPLLKHMAKKGNKRAALALSMAEDTGRTLSTIQVGITLVGILAGAYGGANITDKFSTMLEDIPYIARFADQIALGCVVFLITYMSVVIGEIVPKQFALAHPEKLAVFAAYPLKLVANIGAPIVYVLNTSAQLCLRILNIKQDASSQVTEIELQAVLHEGAVSGVIDQGEYEMLRRIMALQDRDVKTIMTPRMEVSTIDLNHSDKEIIQTITEAKHSYYPVIKDSLDNVHGVIAARDLLQMVLDRPGAPLRSLITQTMQEPPLLQDNTLCHKVVDMFKNHPVTLALVVDEYGNIVGVVTHADILEAIVGSVASNYEDNEHNIIQREDGSWLVNGTAAIEDLTLTIGIEDIDSMSDFTTLAGYIRSHYNRSPRPGQAFEAAGHRFEVIDMDGHLIDKVLITRLPSEEDDETEDDEREVGETSDSMNADV